MPDPDDLEFTLAVADTVAVALENLKRRQELAENLTQVRTENVQLRERLGVQSEIVGQQRRRSQQVAEEIARAAASNATVLIRGESGVGKELVARAIHYSSPRRDNVFVCLNCAALSAELLASELFGHERGAFTGATERKIGKFEAAHRGTLMLDEIGEMSPGIQAKFLRVLEGHPFERVGGSKPITRRRPRDRRHQPRPGEGRGRGPLPPRPLLPPARAGDRRARPAQAARRHPRAGRLFPAASSTPRPAGRSAASRPDAQEQLLTLPLAGQRPRAEERDRAGGGALPRPGDRRRTTCC